MICENEIIPSFPFCKSTGQFHNPILYTWLFLYMILCFFFKLSSYLDAIICVARTTISAHLPTFSTNFLSPWYLPNIWYIITESGSCPIKIIWFFLCVYYKMCEKFNSLNDFYHIVRVNQTNWQCDARTAYGSVHFWVHPCFLVEVCATFV